MSGQVRQRAAAPASPYVGDSRVEYFEPPSRLQLLDKLDHLIRFSDFLLLIQGGTGSGKTSLLRQLKPRTAGGRLCHLTLQAQTGAGNLLRQLGAGCGLEIADCTTDTQLLERIHTEARHAQDAGEQWLLLVDNADLLDDEALGLLVNLQRAGIASVRTVLAGRGISQRLSSTGLAQELDGRLHQEVLQPFATDEAGDFIRLRYPALEVLDSRKLKQLVSESDCMPGSLEQLASRALRLESPRPVVRSDMSGRVLGAASLMLVVIVAMAGWIYWQPEAPSAAGERVSVPLAVPVVAASVDQEAAPINVIEAGTPAGLSSAVQGAGPRQSAIAESVVAAPAVLTAQDLRSDVPAEPSVGSLPEPVAESAGLDEVVVAAQSPVVQQPESGMVEVAVTPEVPSGGRAQSAAVVLPVLAAPEPVVEAKRVVAAPAAVLGEEDLLSWPDRGYTLQLLGARQLETAKGFIADQQNPAAFHAFSTLYKGKPWHVVVIGRYGSRKEASAAVLELPKSLQQLKPWARSIQSVKADIRKAAR